MKRLILSVVLMNVSVAPWGLPGSRSLGAVALTIPVLLAKAFGVRSDFT